MANSNPVEAASASKDQSDGSTLPPIPAGPLVESQPLGNGVGVGAGTMIQGSPAAPGATGNGLLSLPSVEQMQKDVASATCELQQAYFRPTAERKPRLSEPLALPNVSTDAACTVRSS